ncbi:MAG: DUF819 family protein [Candidatus Omnitrophica bacterium]|nr:DUF819 family protein [Candidatus Omnitrophota bacterium]
MGPAAVLLFVVAALLFANRHPALAPLFRWLPVPLWCYAIPMTAVTAGWLPPEQPVYRLITTHSLPVALALLLLGVDLPSVTRTGWRVVTAALLGAAGIILGAPLAVWLLRAHLPPEAWKGAGTLAGTWTGGTMNLLAIRAILEPPEAVFAPLIAVDALIAYGWMAMLVAASAHQAAADRWLRADSRLQTVAAPSPEASGTRWTVVLVSGVIALLIACGAQCIAPSLPTSRWVSSASGWSVLLVTTAALILSLIPPVRRSGAHGSVLGYPVLYLVLAATGAQARLDALWSTPVWVVLGLVIVATHGIVLLMAGRWLRLPLGLLATASQANIGGLVSAPMVGAVYHQSLAPVGLLLALAGNAVGTYLGLLAATLCRRL